LRSKGHEVLASDLVDYESPDQDHARRDFLMELTAPEGFECIVTNPPYKLAGGIIEHALELVPRVYMLLRLAFLESDRRSSILDCGRLRRVYVFANRLPMMHRDGWDGPRATSAMTFAWYVWNRDHSGPTTTKRIYWRPIEERLCAGCQQPFHARVGALTCSDRCRKRVSRLALGKCDSARGRKNTHYSDS
jgi:hypothetical protein